MFISAATELRWHRWWSVASTTETWLLLNTSFQ